MNSDDLQWQNNLCARSWPRAWQQLGREAPQDLLAQLLSAYGQPQRHYHTQQHLAECLNWLESAQELAQHPGEVEIALWFHDAVYEVRAHDNEWRSAQWASQALQQYGATQAQIARVHALIMATCHGAAAPEDAQGHGLRQTLHDEADTQLLLDIDLAILGAAPARFAEYDQQVRAEYSWVPAAIYSVKRKEVLQSFLQRPRIYGSKKLGRILEAPARTNLLNAINAL